MLKTEYTRIVLFTLLPFIFISFFIWLCVKTLYAVPPVWPDEAIFSEMTHNYIRFGKPMSYLYRDFIPYADRFAFWYPPGYFIALSVVYRLFGEGITQIRIFSLVLSAATLLVLYFFISRMFKSHRIAALCIFLLTMDIFFRRISTIGRMEMLTLATGLAGFSVFITTRKQKYLGYYLIPGLLFAASSLTHPVGIIFLLAAILTVFSEKKRVSATIVVLIIPSLVLIAFWLLPQYRYIDILMIQYREQLIRKNFLEPYVLQLFRYQRTQFILVSLYIASVLIFSVRIFRTADCRQRFPLVWLGLCTIVFIPILKEMWYLGYLSVLGSITFADNLYVIFSRRKEIGIAAGILLIFILMQSYVHGVSSGSRQEYVEYGNKLAGALPEGAHVMLSSIPDAYFSLLPIRQDLVFRETPNPSESQPIDPARYDKVFSDSQYVVISYFADTRIGTYIRVNSESIVLEGVAPGNVPFTVIKLKSEAVRTGFKALRL